MSKIAIITNVLPVYRKSFYQEVLKIKDLQLGIYCQASMKGVNLKLCHSDFVDHVTLLNHWSLKKEKICWQWLPVLKIYRSNDLFIFYGNPRVISNVFWSLIFRALGKRVALWGQGHTAGASRITERIRLLWWKVFRNIFVYSDSEIQYLAEKGVKPANIIAMNNGLDQEKIEAAKSGWTDSRLSDWRLKKGLVNTTIILSCARLEKKNQFHMIIECLPELTRNQPDLVWCVIGKGECETELKRLAEEVSVERHILWVGSVYEERLLAPWFLSAQCLVHPGAIGLSLLHAFGYGLPVITHDNKEHHMPEISAMKDGITGSLFREGCLSSLLERVSSLIGDQNQRQKMGQSALYVAENEFNCRVMKDRFVQFVQDAS